jgi:hypothetical protein
MKQRWMRVWTDLTFWALAMRRASREFPDDNDLVIAIRSRQAIEKSKEGGKSSVAATGARAERN